MQDKDSLFAKQSALKNWLFKNKAYFLIVALVIGFVFYVISLLFGGNSIESMWRLKSQQKSLASEIEEIKKQNTQIQKEIFALEELK